MWALRRHFGQKCRLALLALNRKKSVKTCELCGMNTTLRVAEEQFLEMTKNLMTLYNASLGSKGEVC